MIIPTNSSPVIVANASPQFIYQQYLRPTASQNFFRILVEVIVLLGAIPLVGYISLELALSVTSVGLSLVFFLACEAILILVVLREHGKIHFDI